MFLVQLIAWIKKWWSGEEEKPEAAAKPVSTSGCPYASAA